MNERNYIALCTPEVDPALCSCVHLVSGIALEFENDEGKRYPQVKVFGSKKVFITPTRGRSLVQSSINLRHSISSPGRKTYQN